MAAVVAAAEERVSVSGKHKLLDVSAPVTVEQYLHYMKDPLYLRTMLEKDKNDVSEVGDWSEEGERKLKFSTTTKSWFATYRSDMVETQRLTPDSSASPAVQYLETVDAKFTGMPYMSTMQVDTVWDVREVDDHCTIKVQAEVKMPSMIKFVAKKIEASVLAQGKSFAQQMIADMVAKEHDKETDR